MSKHRLPEKNTTKASEHDLTVDSPARSLTVRTTRPSGEVRITGSLIRLEPSGLDRGDMLIAFGRNFLLDTSLCDCAGVLASVEWVGRSGRAKFLWSRGRGPHGLTL